MKKICILITAIIVSVVAFGSINSTNNEQESTLLNSNYLAVNSESGSQGVTYVEQTCLRCHGSGRCATCNGKGWYYSPFGTGKIACPNCTDGRCSACGGSGKIVKKLNY